MENFLNFFIPGFTAGKNREICDRLMDKIGVGQFVDIPFVHGDRCFTLGVSGDAFDGAITDNEEACIRPETGCSPGGGVYSQWQGPPRIYPAAMSEASRLRVGVQLPEVERRVPWLEYLAMARAAEEVGFDSIWLGDHLLYRDDGREERGPWDAWSLLGALAAVTDRVRLGPLVACAGFCPAGLLARRAAAIQEISGGRLVLGLGAGWNETEFRAFGIPFDQRASRFGESFEIIRRLLAGERVTFEGRFERVQDAVLLPLPDVPVPLMVGSTGERVLRAALAHADAWNVWYEWYGNTPEGFATENDRVGRLAREAGTRPRRRPPDGHRLRRPRGRHPRSAPHERRARAHGATRDHRQRAGNLRGGRAARGDPGRQPDHRTLDPNARPNHRRTQHLTWRTQCAVSFNVDDRWTGEDA